jgi:hypothetical protein
VRSGAGEIAHSGVGEENGGADKEHGVGEEHCVGDGSPGTRLTVVERSLTV